MFLVFCLWHYLNPYTAIKRVIHWYWYYCSTGTTVALNIYPGSLVRRVPLFCCLVDFCSAELPVTISLGLWSLCLHFYTAGSILLYLFGKSFCFHYDSLQNFLQASLIFFSFFPPPLLLVCLSWNMFKYIFLTFSFWFFLFSKLFHCSKLSQINNKMCLYATRNYMILL